MLKRLLIFGFLVQILSCQQTPLTSQVDAENKWQKRAWLDKAAKTIRFGRGLSSADPIDAWMNLERAEIVDRLLQDPQFANTVLQFNLYFLGFAPPSLVLQPLGDYMPRTRYDEAPFDKRSALAAALAVMQGGDYFTLFDQEQPFYINHLGHPYDGVMSVPGGEAGQNELRKKKIQEIADTYAKLTDLLKPVEGKPFNGHDYCESFSSDFGILFNNLYAIALQENLIYNFTRPFFRYAYDCYGQAQTIKPEELAPGLATLQGNLAKLATIVDHATTGAMYSPYNPIDVMSISPEVLGFENESSQLGYEGFWKPLQNSSTNHNRKRAAYILKTFFCDDLTPVNVEMPEAHAGTQHASDANCQACHYKLDPMAGFFRYRGQYGFDFEKNAFLLFDDNASYSGKSLQEYIDSWKAPAGSGRTWDVGYVRSAVDASVNTYGESLDDLFKIIRSAPETRQCLTKRMLEFYLGKGQIFDGGWADSLTKNFDSAVTAGQAPSATSTAYKKVVKDIVLSNTFTQTNPQADQCYDYAPGAAPSELPCAVAYLVNKNCAACHNGNGASGNLDLTSWIQLPDGTSTFRHLDANSQQYSKVASFKIISSRLSTTDPKLVMPKGMFMEPNDRAAIFKWIEAGGKN